MIDSLPASLYYARKYLAHACPDARIDSFYDAGERLDLDNLDIAIIPAWHFESVNALRYDVCANIESMQEMNQFHVDHYLNLFEAVAVQGATMYLSNAHDYYFRGTLNYPNNWQKLFCSNTPRSWRHDHRTEIFKKTDQDFSLANQACDAPHKDRLSFLMNADECVAHYGVKPLIRPMANRILSRVASRIRRASHLLDHRPN
jgi:hypothetical protein